MVQIFAQVILERYVPLYVTANTEFADKLTVVNKLANEKSMENEVRMYNCTKMVNSKVVSYLIFFSFYSNYYNMVS